MDTEDTDRTSEKYRIEKKSEFIIAVISVFSVKILLSN